MVEAASLLAPLAAAPDRVALVFDVDGTLAPIAERPELARVPDATRAELERLAGRYLLVACLSGRTGAEAAHLVGVEGIRYVGNHGLELDPHADEMALAIARFRVSVEGRWPIEDKRLSLSFHYRETAEEASALTALAAIAELAHDDGLDARWGRKVLEVRPRVGMDKGAAVHFLVLDAHASSGLYAGDDATDLDAFRGLADSALRHVVRVAVASAESPPGLLEAADLVVGSPAELATLLRLL